MKTLMEITQEQIDNAKAMPIDIELMESKLATGIATCIRFCEPGYTYTLEDIVRLNATLQHLLNRLKTSEADRFESHLNYQER